MHPQRKTTAQKKTVILILLILFGIFSVSSQTTDDFTTLTGGFAVNLPPSADGIEGMGSGIRFGWRQSEAAYDIGFHEQAGLPLGVKDGAFSVDEVVRRYFNKFSTGKLIYKRAISLDGRNGFEYKYETASAIFLLRLFLAGDRLYQLQAEIAPENPAREAEVLRVFDSFRLLSEDFIRAETAKRIAAATPRSLPQSPAAAKARSDLQDRNLKGKVRSVLNEAAHFALNVSLKQKKPTLLEEFDEQGNQLKSIEYSSYGEATDIKVYGYVAGKRVSRRGAVAREYRRGGIALNFPPAGKVDNRFDESYVYKYLGGNLVEEATSLNNGFLISRARYVHLKNKKETHYFDGGTKPFRKITAELDEAGNELKITIFEPEGRKYRALEPYVVKYDAFDAQGNWTRRTISRFYGVQGQGTYFPESVEYRTITYY